MRRLPFALWAPVLVLCGSGCEKTGAYGDMNSIIVGASPELWEDIRDTLYTALEPRIFTVRRERTFKVTHQDPLHRDWANLKKFKQELVVGSLEDPWVAEAVAELEPGSFAPPQILQSSNVWARGQVVTVLLLSPGGGREDVASLLEPLHELYDEQFREYAEARMFVTGRDTALADTLRREAGFELILPGVYYWDRQDSVYLFRNDNPDPSELIRQVMVTWASPGPGELDRDALLRWREEVAASHYATPQQTDASHVEEVRGRLAGKELLQVQAVWENPPDLDWPAGGPFITRAIWCPGDSRVYLIDAWLYAPAKDKYEYMIQLHTILDSFRCDLEG